MLCLHFKMSLSTLSSNSDIIYLSLDATYCEASSQFSFELLRFSSPKFQSDFVSLSSSFIFFTDIFFILQFLVFEFL